MAVVLRIDDAPRSIIGPSEKVGDIELSAVIDKCAAYTPVPGGVGPMTIATLISQTVEAAEKAIISDEDETA